MCKTGNPRCHEVGRTISFPLVDYHTDAFFARGLRQPMQHVLGQIGITLNHVDLGGFVALHDLRYLIT
jgi:hypothetical protein